METKDLTLTQLESDIAEVFGIREKYEHAKQEASLINEELDKKEKLIASKLEELDIPSYKAKCGTFSWRYDESFKIPKTPEARKLFFDFLKEKGIYEDLITVNSMTLNSFAKEELKAQAENGNIDYTIPGLEQPTSTIRVSLRKI